MPTRYTFRGGGIEFPMSTPKRRPSPKGSTRIIRVLLADDHVIVRQGLKAVLQSEPDIEVVDLVASDGWLAIEIARRHQPDVVVMDVQLRGMDGVEATREIVRELPSVRVIGLSMDPHSAEPMLQAGACAFITKDCPASDLIAAIRQCVASSSTGNP